MVTPPLRLDFSHFEQMAQLERCFYGEEFITPPEEAYRWYLRYPYTVVAESDCRRVVGFVNLFPVQPHIARALRAGLFNDHFLTLDGVVDIEAEPSSPLHMFLSCIVVDAAYRHRGITRRLLRRAVEQYAAVSHRCSEVLTDNVTAEGVAFSLRYGFRFLCASNHSSSVYSISWKNLCAQLADA